MNKIETKILNYSAIHEAEKIWHSPPDRRSMGI